MMKIAIIGHKRTMQPIVDILYSDYKDIRPIEIEFTDMDMKEAVLEYLKAQLHDISGIIYTGKRPYEIINSSFRIEIPQAYIRHDSSVLLQALMEAIAVKSYGINKIGCDSYEKEEVLNAYQGFGISGDIKIITAPQNIQYENMIDELLKFYKDSYKNENVSLCLTGISKVYEKLSASNIPCVLMRPTHESINNSILELLGNIHLIDNAESQIVVVSMEIDLPSEYNLIHENEYQLMLEKAKVSEEVYKFAQKVQAAVVESGRHNYLLFSTKKIFEWATDNVLAIPLLRAVSEKSAHTLSIGIGYGKTARDAKHNAALGLNRALTDGGNKAYLVDNGEFSSAIYPSGGEDKKSGEISDPYFLTVSNDTGISINSIYKLYCMLGKTKKDCFTSDEIAKEFGNTRRSVNRMLEKLEHAGYAQVKGTRMIKSSGRPSRIIKLIFNK